MNNLGGKVSWYLEKLDLCSHTGGKKMFRFVIFPFQFCILQLYYCRRVANFDPSVLVGSGSGFKGVGSGPGFNEVGSGSGLNIKV